MKRPEALGGKALPKETGACHLCGARIAEPRQGSISLIYALEGGRRCYRHRLVCRDLEGCRARRKEKERPDARA